MIPKRIKIKVSIITNKMILSNILNKTHLFFFYYLYYNSFHLLNNYTLFHIYYKINKLLYNNLQIVLNNKLIVEINKIPFVSKISFLINSLLIYLISFYFFIFSLIFDKVY